MTISARTRFSADLRQSSQGAAEEQVHRSSGLRLMTCGIYATAGYSHISSTTTNWGGVGGAAQLEWVSLRDAQHGIWGVRGPIVPMTPTAFLTVIGAAAHCRFRVTGYDQFGQPQSEVTPWIALSGGAATNQHWITFSKVFSYVEDVEYQSVGIDIAFEGITVGYHNQHDDHFLANLQITDAGNSNIQTYGTLENWGIGTPLRIGPYGGDLPYRGIEVLHAHAINPGGNYTRADIPPYDPNRANSAGFTIGRNLSGWQGTPHKLGLHSDDWENEKLGVDTTGSVNVPTTTPPFIMTVGDVGEDFLEIEFLIRTLLGTERPSNPDSSYVWG